MSPLYVMNLSNALGKNIGKTLYSNYRSHACTALYMSSMSNSSRVQNYTPNSYSIGSRPPTAQDIKSLLQSKNIKALSGPTCFKCESIFPRPKIIGRPKKDETSVLTLFINKTTGNFFCTATGRRGSWEELCNFVKTSALKPAFDIPAKIDERDEGKIEHLWTESVQLSDVSDITREEVLSTFGLECLPLLDLEQYDIRLTKDEQSIIVPWFHSTNVIGCGKPGAKAFPIGLKILSTDAEGFKKFELKQFPATGYNSLLGLSQVPRRSKTIVLTMDEFDAIAVNSVSSSHKAASLPYGITYLPLEVLPYLEEFSEIILWFNNSQVSWEAARQFAKKLNENRCRIVRPTPGAPNPLEALSKNLNMDEIISSAVSAEIKNIVSFVDLRDFVKDEFMNFDSVCGVKWLRFPKLTEKLKGHRRGELTVVTGPTGSGKTTFMSEYSLDLAMQGVSTLWGSFEIQNVRLLKTLMKQFARYKLEKQMSDFETVAERFQMLPIHFMTYNGPQTFNNVLRTMRQATYMHDIQHIIIDNLQFMMGAMPKNNDRFMVQDMLISEFRNFATTENVHVTVVIHPRKEDSGLPLQISSIFGTAKATQEADNVLILQQVTSVQDGSTLKRSYIEIVKNRYDGELGKIKLYFDKNNLCMSKPPTMDLLDEKLKVSLKPVKDERAVKLNRSGIISENEEMHVEKPAWLDNWQNEAG